MSCAEGLSRCIKRYGPETAVQRGSVAELCEGNLVQGRRFGEWSVPGSKR